MHMKTTPIAQRVQIIQSWILEYFTINVVLKKIICRFCIKEISCHASRLNSSMDETIIHTAGILKKTLQKYIHCKKKDLLPC